MYSRRQPPLTIQTEIWHSGAFGNIVDTHKVKGNCIIITAQIRTGSLALFIPTLCITHECVDSNNNDNIIINLRVRPSFEPSFTSLGSADLSELWGSFRLRRSEKGVCVLQSAAKGHLTDLAVRPIAAHFPLVIWQHLGHCGTMEKDHPRLEGNKTSR